MFALSFLLKPFCQKSSIHWYLKMVAAQIAVISLVISQYPSMGCADIAYVRRLTHHELSRLYCRKPCDCPVSTELHFPVMAFKILVPAMLYFIGTKIAYILGKISVCSLQMLNGRSKHCYWIISTTILSLSFIWLLLFC